MLFLAGCLLNFLGRSLLDCGLCWDLLCLYIFGVSVAQYLDFSVWFIINAWLDCRLLL